MPKSLVRVLLATIIIFFGYLFYVGLTGYYGKPESPHLDRFFEISDSFQSDHTKQVGDKYYHQVPPFALLTQDSTIFTQDSLKDKIYVSDFFFTRCAGRCPKLTMQLRRVQNEFRGDNELMILSHSVDPSYDRPDILMRYAKNMGADWKNWQFLTGTEEEIKELGQYGYFVTAIPGGGAELNDHTGKMVLVDKDRIIRGYYDGTDTTSVNQMMYDIKTLKLEYMGGPRRFQQFEYRPKQKNTAIDLK